jgi:predicted lipoprotein with Yx(FWY)xxD motif
MKRLVPFIALLVAAACGSSSTKVASTPPTTAAPAGPPTLSVAAVTGVGQAIVDAKGKTVYVLTADGKTSLPCVDSTGCTKAWPDITLADGQAAPTPGPGIDASLLSIKKVGDENYVTYKGWLLYEFIKDTAPGTANGEGIKSFGGTWYALDAHGNLVMPGGSGGIGSGY